MNRTHEPGLASWVGSAQGSDFPIQNLPFGVFHRRDSNDPASVGIAIGDQILNISRCAAAGEFRGASADAVTACSHPSLNPLLAVSGESRSALRSQVSAFLAADSPSYRKDPEKAYRLLVPMAEAEMLLPAEIGDYSDFYASIHHATNVGRMFRPITHSSPTTSGFPSDITAGPPRSW